MFNSKLCQYTIGFVLQVLCSLSTYMCVAIYVDSCVFVHMNGSKYYIDTLYILTEIPPVDNLMVADQCTTIRASWDITEGSCTDLSYDITLLSSDGVILQGPFTTSDTVYNFSNVETFNGIFNVNVVPINGNVRGASITETAVISVSPYG